MKKPVLLIMAVGIGSRYGGLKQIDPMDEEGNIIIDFSIYDAIKAGFEKIICIIKEEDEVDFRACIGDRLKKHVDIEYVYQDLFNLPDNYKVPEGRVKPFGTGHAVLSALDAIHGPFAVINADDYYGRHAFHMMFDYLKNHQEDEIYRYAMVGYKLGNTLTEYGHVARGICQVNENGYLTGITERTHIEVHGGEVVYTKDDGIHWESLASDCTVSMNMWGFSESILKETKLRFAKFLDENLASNPLKCEYFLPTVVNDLLAEKKATVQVLTSTDKWYGVTYRKDKEYVVNAIRALKEQGIYPSKLWGE